MSIDKITPLGENGSLENETTFEDWVDGGFVDERVRYTRLNRQFYRGDSTINEMLFNGPKRTSVDGGKAALFSGIYPAGASALDSASRVDTGKGSPDFVDMAYAEIDGVRKIILCDDNEELDLDIIDIETMTYDGVETVPSASLPTPAAAWRPLGITTDALTAYVMWTDGGNAHRIQAYNVADWSVKTGWPATGTLLFTASASDQLVSVIHADDTHLAVPNPIADIGVDPNDGVLFVNKSTGAIDSSGPGDQTSGYCHDRICSNGVYVFTAGGYSIDISTPSSGCGGTNWPLSSAAGQDISCVGDLVLIADGSTTPLAHILHADNAIIGEITNSFSPSDISSLHTVITDGLYFWAQGRTNVNGTTLATKYFRIDPHQVSGEDSTTVEQIRDQETITQVAIVNAVSGNNVPQASAFDGESIWAVIRRTNDPIVYRIPRVNLR